MPRAPSRSEISCTSSGKNCLLIARRTGATPLSNPSPTSTQPGRCYILRHPGPQRRRMLAAGGHDGSKVGEEKPRPFHALVVDVSHGDADDVRPEVRDRPGDGGAWVRLPTKVEHRHAVPRRPDRSHHEGQTIGKRREIDPLRSGRDQQNLHCSGRCPGRSRQTFWGGQPVTADSAASWRISPTALPLKRGGGNRPGRFATILQSGSEENEAGSRRHANGPNRSPQAQSGTGFGSVAFAC